MTVDIFFCLLDIPLHLDYIVSLHCINYSFCVTSAARKVKVEVESVVGEAGAGSILDIHQTSG